MATMGLAAATVAAAEAAGRKRFLPLRLCSLPLARWLNRRLFLQENDSQRRSEGVLGNVMIHYYSKT